MIAPEVATYEDWQLARTHPFDCPCDVCYRSLDDISSELASAFKARAVSEAAV